VEPAAPDPILEPARAALADRRWESAAALAGDLLRTDPHHVEAQAIAAAAERGIAADKAITDMSHAATKKRWPAVRGIYDQIYDLTGDGDPLREQADAIMNASRPKAIADAKRTVDKEVKAHDCDAARRHATEAAAGWGDDARPLIDAAARCKAAPKPPDPTPDPPPGDLDALIAQANDAARSGQYGKALSLCEKALAIKPNETRALMACALSACNLKNAAKAKRYISKLPGSRGDMARQVCLRHGVKVDGAPPKPPDVAAPAGY
jgi:tetratricopeptide (TPR) repeat protein